MVDHYQPRFETRVPSQQLTYSTQSFRLSRSEFAELLSFHRALSPVLDSIRMHGTADAQSANPHIWEGIRRSAPDLQQEGRMPSVIQTEIVMRPDRSFALVSIEAHSSRHLEAVTSISRLEPAALTNSDRLIDGLRARIQGDEIISIKRRDGTSRRPDLAKVFARYGIRVLHLSLEEAVAYSKRKWPFILELPLMQNAKTVLRELYDRATFLIEPFPHLSSQFTLALLSRPTGIGSVGNESLRSKIATTYTLLSPSIPDDAVLKKAHPFSGQKVLGRYGSLDEHYQRTPFVINHVVAQEYIEPLKVQFKPEAVPCPIRLIFVSLKGEILTGMAIARIPKNGEPAHDALLNIVIR